MVEIAICRRGELQCPEADIVERFIINAEGLIGVLNKLMYREGCVVWLKIIGVSSN